jgi:hypothetical protein
MTGFSGALNHPLYYPDVLFTRLCFAADNFSLMISNFHWGIQAHKWEYFFVVIMEKTDHRPQTTDPSSMQCASMFLWVIVLHVLPTNCN